MRGQLARVHAAGGDLGFGIAFGAGGHHLPVGQPGGQGLQGFVGRVADRALQRRFGFDPGVGQAGGHQCGQLVGNQLAGLAFGLQQRGAQVGAGREVDAHGLTFTPEAGDLQHRRPAQAAVGEQQVFRKNHGFFALLGAGIGRAGFDLHRQGQAGELRIRRPALAVKSQRHQRRPWLDQAQAKLPGNAVAEIAGADLGNGQPASGHHHLRRGNRSAVTVDFIAAGWRCLQALDAAGLPALDATGRALGQQHLNDVVGRAVAKQLAFVFFVKRNLVLLQQRDKVLRRVTRQGRAAKMRVVAEELRRRGADVGEVAAPAPRDTDLFGHFFAVVQHQHAQTQLAGHARTKKAGSAGTDHHHVK